MNLSLIFFRVFNQNVFAPEQMIQFILIGTNSDELDSICQASKSLNGLQQVRDDDDDFDNGDDVLNSICSQKFE